MASVVYNSFKQSIANGSIDLSTDDIRVALCMTSTTCDTDNDGMATLVNFGSGTGIDKHDGTNADNAKALANEAVNLDDTNDAPSSTLMTLLGRRSATAREPSKAR